MKTLLINSDGIVGVNPNEDPPISVRYTMMDHTPKERDAENLQRFWQGFVPFEDQKMMKELAVITTREAILDADFVNASKVKVTHVGKLFCEVSSDGDTWKIMLNRLSPIPNSIIEADIEYEVGVIFCEECPYKHHPCPEGCSKKVLRLKD